MAVIHLQTAVLQITTTCCALETDCIELENQMIGLFGHWEDKRFTPARKKVGTRKFHRLFHMVNAIREFGNSDVTCSGRWEHFHKFVAKLQYKRTSRRKSNYSREMHEVHLFLRHIEALTDYQERKGRAWFVGLGKTSAAADGAGNTRLNSPIDASLGFRFRPDAKNCFVVDTTRNRWTGGAGCHLTVPELKELKTQVELGSMDVDAKLLFVPDITLSSSWYQQATGQPNFKIRATRSFHGAPWFDAVRLEVIPDDAGKRKPMSGGRTFTMPQKIHGFAQVLGIFVHTNGTCESSGDDDHQGPGGSGDPDTDGDYDIPGSIEASIFVRWLGGMYEDGEPDANIYERPIPVSRDIGHMKEIGSRTKNPYQIFHASQKAILAPVWLIPEPGKPGQYYAMKNDDNGTWHQFGQSGCVTHNINYDSSGSDDSEDVSRSMTGLLQQRRNQENGKRKQPNGKENPSSDTSSSSSSDDEALQHKQLRGNGGKMVCVQEQVAGTKKTTV